MLLDPQFMIDIHYLEITQFFIIIIALLRDLYLLYLLYTITILFLFNYD